jgi:capsule polysaccharide export protein KpsE/RkpR
MKSVLLIAEGEELLVRTLQGELLRVQEKLKEVQSAFIEKSQHLLKLELDISDLKLQLQEKVRIDHIP